MSQLQKKFIADNAVDGQKLAILNDQYVRARNAANSSYVNLFKLDSSDILTFPVAPSALADAANPNELVRLSQLDARLQGLKPKEAVRVISTANVASLTGFLTIDGVTLGDGDRVLLKDQTTATQNGIYVVAAGAWSRATDMDVSAEFKGAYTIAYDGAQVGRGYVCTVGTSFVLGTDAVTFQFFTAAGTYVAGNGIDITANTIAVKLAGTNPGLQFSTGSLAVLAGPGMKVTASGIEPNLEASNPSLQVVANELGVKMSATGAVQKVSDGLSVKTDDTSVRKNASNQLQSLQNKSANFTLNSTDISNGYVDLAIVAFSTASVALIPVGGIEQENGTDFTVNLTGGVAGVTRVTFAGDLAVGGAAALVSGDKIVVRYKTWF